jgi:uncharacterized protein (TIGR02145 family)
MRRIFFKKPTIILASAVFVVVVTVTIVLAVTTSPVTVTDTFHDTTKISTTTNLTVDTVNGQVFLAPASSWTCGSPLLDSRDGQTYATVLIGSQCWMQQNLNVGDEIPSCTNGYVGDGNTAACSPTNTLNSQGTSSIMTSATSTSIQKFCYADTPADCTSGGGLYQWTQAMGGATGCNGTGVGQPACTTPVQGICPANWHIPSHYEWVELEQTTCSADTSSSTPCSTQFPYDTATTGWLGSVEGTTLKSSTGSFRGVLAGYFNTTGAFNYLGSYALFWSSLQSGSTAAWGRELGSGYTTVYRSAIGQPYGFSVRCVHN